MVPAGAPLRSVVDQLTPLLEPGDVVIDGGNSHYKNSLELSEQLAAQGIHFLDVGTSGGSKARSKAAAL